MRFCRWNLCFWVEDEVFCSKRLVEVVVRGRGFCFLEAVNRMIVLVIGKKEKKGKNVERELCELFFVV